MTKDFLQSSLEDAITLLVADTELRKGQDLAFHEMLRADGERWVVAVVKIDSPLGQD